MHKKSLEMAKKCPSPPSLDSTRSESFCDASERHSTAGKARDAEEDERLLEEDTEEEEVAIDLSSSSKQQQQNEGGATRATSSPQQQSGSESDDHSWSCEEPDVVCWENLGLPLHETHGFDWLFFQEDKTINKKDITSLVAMQTSDQKTVYVKYVCIYCLFKL